MIRCEAVPTGWHDVNVNEATVGSIVAITCQLSASTISVVVVR